MCVRARVCARARACARGRRIVCVSPCICLCSFSHFLPRLDLLPPRDRLLYKELGRVCCSGGLERQLRRLGSDVHVFGHTHINWDKVHNGVRYVQHPLKYTIRSLSLTSLSCHASGSHPFKDSYSPRHLFAGTLVHRDRYPDERHMWISRGSEVLGKSRLAAPVWESTGAVTGF